MYFTKFTATLSKLRNLTVREYKEIMTSPAVIDIQALSQAITDDCPQGSDIRLDRSPNSDYYRIKDARNGARAAERANLFDDDAGVDTLPLWQPVLDTAPQILIETSKDLEVLSWYIEALIRFHGIAGLRDGFALTREIIEQYWDNLYPEPDEDGLETKIAPLTALNGDGGEGTLLGPIRNCKITTLGNDGDFSYWQYQQARDASKVADEDERNSRLQTMGFNLDSIEKTVATGDNAFYITLVADLEACGEHFQAINELMASHCAHETPPSTSIRELLEEVLRTVRFLSKDILTQHQADAAAANTEQGAAPETAAAHATASSALQSDAGSPAPHTGSGAIQHREDALNRLQDVANYFRQHEPHSLLSPAIERVVGWGRMSAAELLMELVPEDNARAILCQLTGIKLDGSDTATYVPPPVVSSPDPVKDSEAEQTNDSWNDAPSTEDNDDLSW